jgi:hypothetical protein
MQLLLPELASLFSENAVCANSATQLVVILLTIHGVFYLGNTGIRAVLWPYLAKKIFSLGAREKT